MASSNRATVRSPTVRAALSEKRRGPEGMLDNIGQGDVLRLQYLNDVEIRVEDVHTASDFGEELVDLIFRQKRAAER